MNDSSNVSVTRIKRKKELVSIPGNPSRDLSADNRFNVVQAGQLPHGKPRAHQHPAHVPLPSRSLSMSLVSSDTIEQYPSISQFIQFIEVIQVSSHTIHSLSLWCPCSICSAASRYDIEVPNLHTEKPQCAAVLQELPPRHVKVCTDWTNYKQPSRSAG